MTSARPIASAWISATGSTGAQNYDEFATDGEITSIIAGNPDSALALEMPHRTPASVEAGRSFSESLLDAAGTLASARSGGLYRPAAQVVVPYRISGSDGPAYGLFCLIDTDQISTSADEPGLVIRNEDVFAGKVVERMALTERLGAVLSPVLLLQSGNGERLHDALDEVIAGLGDPAVTDVDQHGNEHAIWLLGPGDDQDRLLDLAGTGELIVADGNHRSLAAQNGRLDQFLAVVTTPHSVRIKPYNRLLRGVDPEKAVARLLEAGLTVTPLAGPLTQPTTAGTVVLHGKDGSWQVDLPAPAGGSPVDRLDHTLVERVVLGQALGIEPGDPAVSYIGGDYPAQWLAGEVDAGRADLAVLIAPVSVVDFVEVNRARLTMPRKSTWFTPKARAGLVVADVTADGRPLRR